MASLILPAHNEGSVIGKTIQALLPQLAEDDELIVVCNGCSDNTSAVARSFGPRVKVVDSPIASKVHALNLGDSLARAFPRFYIDADVELRAGAVEKLKAAVGPQALLAAAPEPCMDFSGSSWAVRAYYRIWLSLPYCRSGMMGAGVYVLSEQGRRRFSRFPDLIADDGYVRALFAENERANVPGAQAVVKAPATLRWLLKIKTRSRLGQIQLAQCFPLLLKNEKKAYAGGFVEILKKPLNWPAAAIYLYVAILTRIKAKRLLKSLDEYQWEKDESSR